MSKNKPLLITISVLFVAMAAALVVAWNTNLLLTGDYYVKIDNACFSENESTGGIVNLKSSEPYLYELEAVDAEGTRTNIEFGTSRELRQDAFLKLELQPFRGVVGWTEVSADTLPSKVAEALG